MNGRLRRANWQRIFVLLPKKILHVLSGATGGAPLSTTALIEELARRGIRSCAVCHDLGNEEDRERLRQLTDGEVLFTPLYWWNRKIRSPLWRRPLGQLKQLIRTGAGFGSTRRVLEQIARTKPDLIHTNTILTPEGGWASRQCGLPHIWHVRELVGPGQPFRFYRGPSSFGRYLVKYADRVIANARGTAELLAPWLPTNFMELVPNGIEIGALEPRTRLAARAQFKVGMVATLKSRVKKHSLFIEAAAQVDRSLPIEWEIYGEDPSKNGTNREDPYTNRLLDLIQSKGMSDRFRFCGHVGTPAEIMNNLDVLVQPNDQESFGRVVVEAMAAAVPVVSVNGGGAAELVIDGETGILASPDNAFELAQGIERLIRDVDLAARFGAAGRKRAESTYNMKNCVDGIVRVYESVFEKKTTTT